MNFIKHEIKKFEMFIKKQNYHKLMKKIKNGEEIEKATIEKVINSYFKNTKIRYFNHQIFPYLDDSLFDATNKEIQFFVYSLILSNILRIKEGLTTLTLDMNKILVGSKIAHRHTLLNFLLTQKQYPFMENEILLLKEIDNVRESITDSYSLETGIKR